MGCDISPLSRHNLNISNVETLALDLSNRFGFNIDYGYFANDNYNKLLHNGLKEDYVSLGILILNTQGGKAFQLVDDNYQKKQLVEKYGDALFQKKEYWDYLSDEIPNEQRISEEKAAILKAEYSFENKEDFGEYQYFSVYDEVVANNLHYYTRWWDLCRTITEDCSLDYFVEYRIKMMKDTVLFGGDKIYYVNDQCQFLGGVGQGSEGDYTWEELEKYIYEKVGHNMVSIPETVLNPDFQRELSNKKEFPLAFVDDFRDLLG